MSPFLFFRVVPVHSPYLLHGFGIAAVVGAVSLIWEPASASRALLLVLTLQMCAAATGFDFQARRGHFDLLLTGGSSRARIALVHFGMSVVPGAAVWLALILVELAASGGTRSAAMASGSLAALAMVSMLSWAVTVPLPRLTGGVIWLLLIVAALAARCDRHACVGVGGTELSPAGALDVALLPFAVIGRPIQAGDAWIVGPALGVAVGAWLGAISWIAREAFPLETAQ